MAHRFGRSFDPAFHPELLGEPLRKKKSLRIFVCSAADLFGRWVAQEWIDQVLAATRHAHRHVFQFLTKNPERLPEQNWPPNSWVGATATGQAALDVAVHYLQRVKAPVRYISAEPLLGPMKFKGDWFPEWLIVGALTGPKGRQPDPDWVDKLVRSARGKTVLHFKPNLAWMDPPRDFPSDQNAYPVDIEFYSR